MNKAAEKRPVFIVTGLSGAGKSSALAAFEDLGYHTVDNLPLTMLENLLDLESAEGMLLPVAVGIDSRTLYFSPQLFSQTVQSLKARFDIALHILFMEASDTILMQRFSETRRRHPLAKGRILRAAIKHERSVMSEIRHAVDGVVDTSLRTGAETRRIIQTRFTGRHSPGLRVTFMSFGFAKGVPRDADMMIDVRFLRNPHYNAKLQPLTGQEKAVANFVRADEGYGDFMEKLIDFLSFLLPRYVEEGKSSFTVAFGCTGGRHRSVAVAEAVAKTVELDGAAVNLYHRELMSENNVFDETGIEE